MSSKSSPWYRGMAPHVLSWAAATTIFLAYDRPGAAIRFPLSFALGLTCLAAFFAARTASANGKRRRAGRSAYFAISGLVLALLSLHGAYVWSVGRLQAQAIESILQTDFAEAFGYVATRLLFLWAVLWAVSVTLVWLTFPTAPDRVSRRGWVQAGLLAAGLVFLASGRSVITEPLEVVESYREGTDALRQAARDWKARPPPPIASDFRGTIILVIGESTSRHHMSLYGYPRNTTPQLSALRPELAVFGDVISNETTTIDSVIDSLTLRPGSAAASADEGAVGVLQLANAAGFATMWLSNQNEFGVWDNPVRILAQQADRVRFHDSTLGTLTSRTVFDEAMLPSLDQALSSPGPDRRLIVMHLMSTHLPYCWTKPSDFNPLREEFGKRLYGRQDSFMPRLKRFVTRRTRDLDCYDNGIRYVDGMLGAVIARARGLGEPAAVLYFSDHGEAPLLATGHDSAEHSAYQLEIPFILWGNAEYRAAYPDAWKSALANRSQPFSLERMAPTLLDLMQLGTPLLRTEDSLFDPAYRPRQRIALDGRFRYDSRWRNNDYRENSRVFVRQLGAAGDRVWSHRVNSLGALLEAKRTFSGIEIDVHYDSGSRAFQVRHDYPHIGLTLRDMLEWSRDRPGMKIWLDWKNAAPDNVQAALSELTALDREFGLKRRLLVETDSSAVSPALAAISKAGFRHGYYLPTEAVLDVMRNGEGAMHRLASELKQVVVRGRFDAVTYDAQLQPFVTAKLDAFLSGRGIRRYSWDTSIDSGQADTDPAGVAAMVRERRLEALLITFPSDFWM